MDNLIILTKNSKEELIKEIITHIDEGYIPVGNLEKIEASFDTAEGYEYADYPIQVQTEGVKFTQSMYKPNSSTLSTNGGSYKTKNKNKKKTKSKTKKSYKS